MRAEEQIQAAVVDWIAVAAPTVIAYAVPNSSVRAPGRKASNAVPGLCKGVWDLALVLPNGHAAFIEVKTAKGVLSADQIGFGRRLAMRGIPHVVARSIDDVRKAFEAWGVPHRETPYAPLVIGERTGGRA